MRVNSGRRFTVGGAIRVAFVGGCVLLFVLWPIAAVLSRSVYSSSVGPSSNAGFSLVAYRGLFQKNQQLLLNSFNSAALTALCASVLSLLIALKLVYGNPRGRNLVWFALFISTISPPFVGSMAYIMLFGKRGLVTWRLLGVQWNPYGLHGVVMMETLSVLGVTTLLMTAALRQIDGNLERASLDLGAKPLRTFFQVSLPQAFPGIAAAAFLAFVRSLSDFGTPLVVGGRFQVLASRAYNTLIGVGDFRLACAMNVLLLLPSLAVLLIRNRGTGGVRAFSTSTGASSSPIIRLPSFMRFIFGVAAGAFVTVQFLVYGLIFLGAITRTWGADFSLTTAHLASIFDFRAESFTRSLFCSLVAGAGGAVLGAVLARQIEPLRGTWRSLAQTAADLPYLVPGTFFGVGYLLVSSSLSVKTGIEISVSFMIAANCLFRQLSPSTRSAQAGLAVLNPELESAIHDLGGSEGLVLRDLIFPHLRPFMLAAFVNSFSSSMMSTGPIIFLVSPYAKVASVELFEAINHSDFGAASAMSSVLIVIVMFVIYPTAKAGGLQFTQVLRLCPRPGV